MKAYTAIISRDGEQKSLEINSRSQQGVRSFIRDNYPEWEVVKITEHH